jgi:hypothetical protein
MTGPGDGRERNLEDIAQGIMNQSDEGVDDLLGGTEVFEDNDEDDAYSPQADEDDGGDYSE